MISLATLSMLFIVTSAVFVAIGWLLVIQRKIQAHIRTMQVAAVFALTFFIVYVSRTIFEGNTAFGGPEQWALFYHSFLIFHILLATIGAILGLMSLYYGFKNKLDKHRRIGPYTSVVWFATAITGVTVYMFLYIIFTPGETTNVIRAIFNF